MMSAIRRLFAILSLTLASLVSLAQPFPAQGENKPYKVLTSGRQITIKSGKAISHVMVWTEGGDRVVEQRDINASSYSVDLPVNQKRFFVMISLKDGRRFTERIGIR
jgi:hypothetical protein